MKKEVWKQVAGYEDYMVSNYGRVKSLERVIRRSDGKVLPVPERILKAGLISSGYLVVNLHKNGESKMCYVHRLVAEVFLENPNNLSEINHKDENKLNNRVENLEWCTHAYNLNYGTRTERTSKQVAQIDRSTGEVIRIWPSTIEVQRQTGFNHGYISKCALGKLPHAYKYLWRYLTN